MGAAHRQAHDELSRQVRDAEQVAHGRQSQTFWLMDTVKFPSYRAKHLKHTIEADLFEACPHRGAYSGDVDRSAVAQE